jgi:hypothetical protein
MDFIMPRQDTLQSWWEIELQGMPQFDKAMKRVYAWFENEIIDRPPVRFMAHNAFLEQATEDIAHLSRAEKKNWWFNSEQQVDLFIKSIEGRQFYGETFPVFFPNLGPDVYAAFYGAELVFGEVTSYSVPYVQQWEHADQLILDQNNQYFQKIEDLTLHAIERCEGKFLVGYTDLHPGLDCVAAWRDPLQLCYDLYDNPVQVQFLADLAIKDFETIYDHFDALLKENGQLSVSWMGIPSFGRMHIPSCDFSALISQDFFIDFGLPILQQETKTMTHNIFHVDGQGVSKHLEAILSVPEINAVQWVQGVGDDYPIMQWVSLINEMQAREIPVIVDLSAQDLTDFMDAMDPKGLFIWVAADTEQEEIDILKHIEMWT